jgi:hypothetical protein
VPRKVLTCTCACWDTLFLKEVFPTDSPECSHVVPSRAGILAVEVEGWESRCCSHAVMMVVNRGPELSQFSEPDFSE